MVDTSVSPTSSPSFGASKRGTLRRVVVIGATGMVGTALVRSLLEHPSCTSVATLVRRSCDLAHDSLERHVIDFERMDDVGDVFAEADAVFSCLGTTLRQQRGDRQGFRRVDLEYPLAAARLAAKAGARQFLFISSVEANPTGRLFQSRIKGELEAELAKVALQRVIALQPSVLYGNRPLPRRDERFALHVMRALSPLLRGSRRAYRPIRVADLVRDAIRSAEGLEPMSHLRVTSLR